MLPTLGHVPLVMFVHETSATALKEVPSSAMACEEGSSNHLHWVLVSVSISFLLSGGSPDASLDEETW